MTRADWQQIAEERLIAANALLEAKLWASSYYIVGYAVESGLKSCIVKRIAANPEILFQEGGTYFSKECWTHDIVKLVRLAGIKTELDNDSSAHPGLATNWGIVGQWSEKSRYQTKSQPEAEALYHAIADNANGVMQWIRERW